MEIREISIGKRLARQNRTSVTHRFGRIRIGGSKLAYGGRIIPKVVELDGINIERGWLSSARAFPVRALHFASRPCFCLFLEFLCRDFRAFHMEETHLGTKHRS